MSKIVAVFHRKCQGIMEMGNHRFLCLGCRARILIDKRTQEEVEVEVFDKQWIKEHLKEGKPFEKPTQESEYDVSDLGYSF